MATSLGTRAKKGGSVSDLGKTYKIGTDSETAAICGDCNRKVTDTDCGIQCDDCRFWYHIKCCKISRSVYELMGKHDELQWRCAKCKEEYTAMVAKLRKLTEENKLLHERLSALDVKFESLKTDLKNEIIQNVSDKINVEVQKSVSRAFGEIRDSEEKQRREPNLILYNVEESQKRHGKEREDDDRTLTIKILEHCVGGGNLFTIEKLIRLGRMERNNNLVNKPRPLLVKFKNVNEKWNVLKNARQLKTAPEEFKRAIIAPDLTKEEREKDKNLRLELKTRRDQGEKDIYIKRGEIVKGNFFQK